MHGGYQNGAYGFPSPPSGPFQPCNECADSLVNNRIWNTDLVSPNCFTQILEYCSLSPCNGCATDISGADDMKDGTCFPNVMKSYQRFCVDTTTEGWMPQTTNTPVGGGTDSVGVTDHEKFVYFAIGILITLNVVLLIYFLHSKFLGSSPSEEKVMLNNVHNQNDSRGYDFSHAGAHYPHKYPHYPERPITERSWRAADPYAHTTHEFSEYPALGATPYDPPRHSSFDFTPHNAKAATLSQHSSQFSHQTYPVHQYHRSNPAHQNQSFHEPDRYGSEHSYRAPGPGRRSHQEDKFRTHDTRPLHDGPNYNDHMQDDYRALDDRDRRHSERHNEGSVATKKSRSSWTRRKLNQFDVPKQSLQDKQRSRASFCNTLERLT